jgi:transposase
MARLRLAEHLSSDELQRRYRTSADPVEQRHWQVLWLLSQGRGSQEIAQITSFSVIWVRILVRRFNEGGPEAVGDHRHHNPGGAPLLDARLLAALAAALEQPPEDGGLWSGPKAAQWMSQRLRRRVHPQRGWEALRRLGYTPQRPRPRHTGADPAAQARFPA